jgi:hypothetical protein
MTASNSRASPASTREPSRRSTPSRPTSSQSQSEIRPISSRCGARRWTRSSRPRRLESRRPGADDEHAPRHGGGRGRRLALAADVRVHGAPGAAAAGPEVEEATDAALVAPDARPHRLGTTGERGRDERGVGDRRAHHRDEVRDAGREDRLRLRERRHTSRDDRRDARAAGHGLARRELVAERLVHRSDQLPERVVAAHRDVDEVDEPVVLESDQDPDGLRRLDAALDAFAADDPDPDGEGRARRRPDRRQHLACEPDPVGAVRVVARVRERREERVDEVRVGAVHLDAVEPGPLGARRRGRKALDDRVDHRLGHRLRDAPVDRVGEPGGCPRGRAVARERLDAAVPELGEDARVERV